MMEKQLLSLLGGDIENVIITVQNSTFDFNVKDQSGATLLHYAVEYGNQRIVQWLLSKGCNVNSQDSKGITPLMMAALGDQKEIAVDLLEAGADINIVNGQNESVLQMVFAQHRLLDAPGQLFREFRNKTSSSEDKAKRLMALGCHLYQAAYFENHRILEIMLDAGFPVQSMHPESKQTALHNAVMLGDADSVKVLLRYGADAEALDSNGMSPLFFNIGLNRTYSREILKILLVRGVSMTSLVTRGMFQISPTLLLGDGEAIRLLLENNISFTAKEIPDGRTVLHYLAVNTDPGIVEPLKRHAQAYDVNILDSFNTSPLFYAVRNGTVEMTEFLLDRGARIDYGMCKNDYPPLYNAITRSVPHFDNARCVELLFEHNVDPQLIYSRKNKKLSMIDVALKTKNLNVIHPIIAHLALIEKLGTPITELTNAKIDLHDPYYREYFNECQRILDTKISGSVTVFKLLAGNKKKLAMHLNKRKLYLKLRRISNKQGIRCSYLYYYNTLRKNLRKGITHKSLRDNAAKFLSRIFRYQIDRTHLIINKMIDYLNDQDIRLLSQV